METAISCMLLLLLAGVAVAIYAKGQIYDPGLYRPELTALSKQAPIEARSVEPRTDQPASAGAQMPSPDAGRQAPSSSSPLDESGSAGMEAPGECHALHRRYPL